MESLQSRLVHAQEEIRDERRRADQIAEKLRQCQSDLESLPLLRAQIEVFENDFNAERAAREKIAGEKADLIDEVRRLRAGGLDRDVHHHRVENTVIYVDFTKFLRYFHEIFTMISRKFQHSFVTQILREIKVGDFSIPKTVILTNS